MRPPRPWLLLSLSVASLALTGPARAQSADRVATAQALFEQGRALVEAGELAVACPRLRESQRLDPGVGTMLWLAECYAESGQTASAWAGFKEAAATAARSGDRRRGVALARRDELEKRLSRLAIVVPQQADTDGLEVRCDGVPVARGDWGLAMPLDPGVHWLSASAPGRRSWSASVQIAAGPTSLAATVPVLEAGADEPTGASRSPGAGSTDEPGDGHEGLGGQRWVGIASMGLGAVGLIAGSAWALQAKSTYDQSTAGPCDASNVCTQAGLDERSSARTMATGATVAMGVGAVAAVTGAILFFTAPSRAGAVAVTPAAWQNGASVTMTGAF